MPIRTRRWNDPKKRGDGWRILICRYRPRALPKTDETWDKWYPDLGPSKELHAAFYGKRGDPISWEEYRRRYLEEMKEREEMIEGLADLVAEGKTITLLCSSACTKPSHCHRTLLKQLIEERVQARAQQPATAPAPEASA
jgi:uncharacterized protein YeaO (DUF488 family)